MSTVFTLICGLNGDKGTPEQNRAALVSILNERHPDGYTLVEATGCWNGDVEPTLLVLFIVRGDSNAFAKGLELETTAWRYKNATGQQEVWITRREEGLTVV
jgi:hypothetical protein